MQACSGCGLRHQCLCSAIPRLSSELSLSLLTHENEYQRETNTGRWLVQSLPSCSAFTWQRTSPPEALLQRMADPNYHSVLVYPSEQSVPVTLEHQNAQRMGKKMHFIVLDGTWQEAKKMLRKSPWLAIPHVQINAQGESCYQLRRHQQVGHLCTLEVGSALLNALNEPQNAQRLNTFLHRFMHTLQADKSGHALVNYLD
ncbi:tRNA-uridine aminocarboxypropyltransferase [Vibrio cincinnatiensis]|uniref:tRNA-uridine aminocarboxypropyltransferase n=1 Tax=Vibrio cincinnatiensis TaxID=675 RepID=UPI001EE1298F|nr:DTW domain-containing protein [Vibrio cincinnatiensis]MCG3725332.1 DTW domain-containing protein [Vibrio cincinnatiensis]MCG3758201.1 DTW domain-containing protein [Vibrio cincinnatiensis]MCG3761497.1 DTW domain-containing protein [Vibrio cincinnatiensis]